MVLYSIFLNTYFVNDAWVSEKIYYLGNCSKWSADDWRICEVQGKKLEAIFLGFVLKNDNF